jgi:1-acyl-sn-glycerol-3-phosphate acyltransferase
VNFYSFASKVCEIYFKTKYKVEVIGQENIPKEGGILLCSNHISNLDPPLVGSFFPRDVHFMAKEELFKTVLLNKVVSSLKAFPVRRGMSDKQALRKGLGILKDGEVLGIFPEGTRSKDGKIGEGLTGVGFFALRSNAYVVPSAIIGSYKRNHLKIVYGKPVDIDKLRSEKASAKEATDFIMKEIEELFEKNK